MIAYLNTEYPSLSHTFIEREIRALRAAGVRIQPFSIRPATRSGRLGAANESAARETISILDHPVKMVLIAIWALACSPIRGMATLLAGQRLSPPGLRCRLIHGIYALEGIRLGRELRRRSIHHIHVHMANNGAMVAILACTFVRSIRYSLTIHGSAEFFQVDTLRLREKVERAQFVRCISNFCRAQVMAWTNPERWPELHVVHCGVDTRQFDLKSYATAPAMLRMVTVGRLHAIKGHSLLINACGALCAKGIPWSLNIVGSGDLEAALKKQVDQAGLAANVTFSGAVSQEDVAGCLAAADVLVVSSFMEGLPVVIMEAMAMGLVVLSTNVAGIPEIVEDGISGNLVSPGSVTALTEGMAALHSVRPRFQEMGLAGRRRICNDYCIERVALEMASLFKQHDILGS